VIGKPKQDLTLSGGIVHSRVRDPFSSAFMVLRGGPGEVFRAGIRCRAGDGPHNQTKSDAATNGSTEDVVERLNQNLQRCDEGLRADSGQK
jgi:hypothetical protein